MAVRNRPRPPGMRIRPAPMVVCGCALVPTAALAAWVCWLSRRRATWRITLADAIPVNSAYWRGLAAEAGRRPDDLLYVAIGDSAAQGIGASRPGHSYVGFIARGIRSAVSRPLRVVNLAASGATIRIVIEKELPLLARLHPDVLTVSVGANDIAAFDPTQFDADIHELLGALPPHALVADLPSFYFLPGQRRVRAANRLLRGAAAEAGLRVVPLHRATDRQGLRGVVTQFAGDLFHPNDRGYRVWARAFRPAVEDRLAVIRRDRLGAAAGAHAGAHAGVDTGTGSSAGVTAEAGSNRS